MKVGDLIKFRDHNKSPQGVVLRLETLENGPHPSQPQRDVAYVQWACPYTMNGHYQLCLLEVISESR